MSRFDFVSPGAAFTDELTKVLAERKAEERQKLLDSLTMKAEARAERAASLNERQVEAEMVSNAQRNKHDEQRMTNENDAAEQRNVDFFTKGMRSGDDASSLSPSVQGLGQKWGKFHASTPDAESSLPQGGYTPISGGSAFSNPLQSSKLVFSGSPEERLEEENRKKNGPVIAQLLSNPATAEAGKRLQLANSVRGGLSEDVLKFMPNNVPIVIYDPVNNSTTVNGQPLKAGEGVPANALHMQRSRPPREPIQHIPVDTHSTNSAGEPVWFDFGANKQIPMTGLKPTRGAPSPGETSLGIPVEAQQNFRDILDQLKEKSGFMSGLTGAPPTIDPAIIQEFQRDAVQIIGTAKRVSPKVTEALTGLINEPEKWTPEAESALIGTFTQEERSDFGVLKSSYMPTFALKLLQKHAPKKVSTLEPNRLEQLLQGRPLQSEVGMG